MNSLEDQLFPKPKYFEVKPGFFNIPSSFTFHIENSIFQSLQEHLHQIGNASENNGSNSHIIIVQENKHDSEGYHLKIIQDKIIIHASEPAGAFHGLQTLKQILKLSECESKIPCIELTDFPKLKRRGFMLDVSRCKVPTMDSVFSLIDLLSVLHINEFQLYIEHTFAFQAHQTVWENASPFTAEEIQKIDQYCKERFIELVPNLNSFGHFERWLRHADYKHLAECPDGFRRENPFIERDHGTTLKPNQQSLDFINSLYAEYLPNFSSNQFNVGMDEPWELGQGWCKDKVEEIGKDKVYLNHLDGIRKLVESHGKEMHFWADVLLEKPENAKLLSPTTRPIIWGYEPDHPFDLQAKAISSCGLKYCLAPGTGTWRSFTGRWSSAKENINSAIKNTVKHDAEGILLTSWGDCGNHQPWATLYPALLYGAAKSWNNQKISDRELCDGMNFHLFEGQKKTPAKALIELGELDKQISSKIPNTSLCWFILFAPLPEKLLSFLKKNHNVQQLQEGIKYLQTIQKTLNFSDNNNQINLVDKEISMGIELSMIALNKAIKLLQGKEWEKLSPKHNLFSNYEKLWLTRARKGGLQESMSILLECLANED